MPCASPAPTAGTRFLVGARLARDSGDAVHQADRVIVHRGQAALPQRPRKSESGRTPEQTLRSPTEAVRSLWERGLPAIRAMRFVRQTALSFFAGKPGSNSWNAVSCWSEACPRNRRCGSSGRPRYRSSWASRTPTRTGNESGRPDTPPSAAFGSSYKTHAMTPKQLHSPTE